MRHFFRRHLPNHQTVQQHRWLRPYAAWLSHPNLWHLNRRSVSGGVAVGMFCGLIPGPLQMLGAAIGSVLFRVNLPTALFTTLYTNPLTILPLYLLAYEVGVVVSGAPHLPVAALPLLTWQNGISELWTWLVNMGKPLLIGLPLLAIALSLLGYLVVRISWRVAILLRWRHRQKSRQQ
jgi:uncharacterized protein (DUF2062 family)